MGACLFARFGSHVLGVVGAHQAGQSLNIFNYTNIDANNSIILAFLIVEQRGKWRCGKHVGGEEGQLRICLVY